MHPFDVMTRVHGSPRNISELGRPISLIIGIRLPAKHVFYDKTDAGECGVQN